MNSVRSRISFSKLFRDFGISGFRDFGFSGFRDFGISGFQVFKFSSFQVLTLDMGLGKIRDQSDAFSGFQIFKFRHLEDVRFPLDRFTAFTE